MKKIFCIVLTLSMLAAFTSCTKNDTATKAQTSTTGVNDIIQNQSSSANQDNITEKNLKKKEVSKVDLDLSVLNGNLVYSNLYDIMSNSDNYMGKQIKIKGTFYEYKDPATGQKYFSCFIADAAACCSQGLEFELTDDYKYPDDYPAENQTITVAGTFETYREGQNEYCRLKDAVFCK